MVASAVALCNRCDVPGVPLSPYTLIYTAEGIEEDVQAELKQVRAILKQGRGPEPIEIADISGTDVWRDLLSQNDHAAHVRVGLPVRDVPLYANDQSSVLNTGAFFVDFANGFVYVSLPVPGDETIERLRVPALQAGGYAVVTHLPESWQGQVNKWGYTPGTLELMKALKARWDPRGILGALMA